MIQVSTKIHRPREVVWRFFVTPENWIHWYGGKERVGVEAVEPDFQEGGRITWTTAGDAPITSFKRGEELTFNGGWTYVTFRFTPEGEATVVEVVESEPRMAAWADGGASQRANWQEALRKLKECIETEP